MSIQFDHLPIVLLEDIFKLLDPTKLFDLRFLNKYLFNIANNTIKYNLSYSIYYYNVSNQYRVYQQNFIEQNGTMMKHIYLYDDNLKLLNKCPNITSLEIDDRGDDFDYDEDTDYIDEHIEFSIKTNLTKLKKLVIYNNNIVGYLKLFNNYLNQIEIIELREIYKDHGFGINIDNIVKHLIPNKLKSLTLDINELSPHILNVIKTKFVNLKELDLAWCNFHDTPINLNPNVNFASHLKLKIEGCFGNNFNIEFLGNLNCLKQIELKDTSTYLFDTCSDIKLIEKDNLFVSGESNFNMPIDHYLTKLAYSKQLYVYNLSAPLFNILPSLPNMLHLFIGHLSMNYYYSSHNFDLNEPSKYKVDFIKQITVIQLDLYLDEFLSFLSFFPNLQVIKIRCFKLVIRESTVTYNPPTSLLLITSIPYKHDPELYRALDQIFKMNWIKYGL
ncbi:hypothetical protein K502DRAFT_328943 [Neoconidiobolus thromboides FSU 785]|nr:hypothetical protein K502DRAFT_328943 [Neoconidiobolus thromboides FSU 785]